MLIMIVCACASVLIEAGIHDEEKAAENVTGNGDVMRVCACRRCSCGVALCAARGLAEMGGIVFQR